MTDGATPGRRRGAGAEGFLLVEALSALALGALILVALLSLAGLLRRSADRAAYGVEVSEVSNRTIDTIAREIRQAQRRRWAAPPPPAGAKPTPAAASSTSPQTAQTAQSSAARVQQMTAQQQGEDGAPQGGGAAPPPRPFVFSGAPDKVLFVLTPVQDSRLRAPVMVVYQIEAAGSVLRAEAALPPDAVTSAAVQLGPVERIDPGPERLRFAYVDRQPTGDEVVMDVWTDPLKMPAAIRIDRTDLKGQPVGSLRVPLLIDGEPGCAAQKGLCSRVEGGAAAPDAPDAQGAQPGQQSAPASPTGQPQ